MREQPQTRHALRAQERRAKTVLAVVVVVGVMVLGTAVYFGTGLLHIGSPSAAHANMGAPTKAVAPSTSPDLAQLMNGTLTVTPSPETSTTTEPTHKSAAAVGSIPANLASAVSSCQAQWRLESAAVADAGRSLSQWRRHLEIMNDLQAGRISLATAKAQWPYTTYKAVDNVVAFRSADAALAASPDTCAVDNSATGRAADAIRACAASLRTDDSALVKARVAIAPWERHLKDQTHFAMGMMTSATAEAKWRVMWKTGLATLPPWDAVAGSAQAAVCPLAD
jgi:hypothetical protein